MQQVFQEFQQDLQWWGQGPNSLDGCFYALTQAFPNHGSRAEIFGKLHFIEKMFQTNASKAASPQGYGHLPGAPVMNQLVEVLEANGAWLDQRLAALPYTHQPTHNEFYDAVGLVEDLYGAIHGATNRRLWTFASKYLHCHRPCVPIVDSRARTGVVRVMRRLTECGCDGLEPMKTENQMRTAHYQTFVDHLWRLYDFYRHNAPQGQNLTLKQMDFHLYKRGGGQA